MGKCARERVEFGTEAARSGPWSRRGAGGLTCGWVLWDNQVGFFGPGVGEMVFVPTIPYSVTVIDCDHDPYPDLLVTEVASGHQQARILRNRFGSSQNRAFDSTTFAVGQTWNGAVVADFNLDGQDDFVLLPRSADVVPAAFMSTGYMLAPEFEDWPAIQPTGEPTTPTYRDLGYTLGIRDGRTGGGFAADLDGDHAPDLFLGRDMVGDQGQPSGEQCLYRSTGSAGTTQPPSAGQPPHPR